MPANHACEDEPWTFSALFSLLSDTLLSLLLLLSSVVSCFTSQMAALLDLHLGHEDHWQLPNSSFGGRSFAPASSRLFKEEQAMQEGGGGACSVCSFRNPAAKTESEHFRRPPRRREKSPPREEEEEEEIAWKKMGSAKVNREKSTPPPVPISQPCHTEDWDSESSVDSIMHRSTRKVDHKKSAPILAPVGRSSHTRDRDSESSVDSDKHRSSRKVDHKKPAPIPVPVGRSSHTRDQDSESSVDSDECQSTQKVDHRNSASIPVSQREDRGVSKFSVDSDKHPLTQKVDRKKSAPIPVSGDRSSHLEEPDSESLVDSSKRQSTWKADRRKSIPIPVSVDRSSQREDRHSKLSTNSDKHPLTRKVDCKKPVSVPISVDRPPRTEEQDSEFCMDSGKNPLTRKVDRKKSASTAVFIDRSYQMEDGWDSKLSMDSNKHPPPQNGARQKPAPIPVSVDRDSEFSVDSDKHLSLAWKVDHKKSTLIPVSVDQSSQTENWDSKFSMDSDKHHLSSRKAGRKKSAASIPVFVDRSSQTEDRDYSDKHQPPQKGGRQKPASIPVSVDHAAQMEDRDKHPSPQKSDREKSTSNPLSADRGNMNATPIAVLVDWSTQAEHRPASGFSMDSDKHPPAQNRKPVSVPVLVDQDRSKTASIPAMVDRSTQLEDWDSEERLATQEAGCEKATSTPVSVDRSTQEDDWNEQRRAGGTLTDSVAASEELPEERKEMGSVRLLGEREEEAVAVAAMEDNNVFLGNNLHAGPGESRQEPVFPSDESKPGVEEDAAAEGEGDGDAYYLQDIGYIRGLEDLRKAVRDEKKQKTELYAELERERQAAAIAAMETMAMITRLQEEKSAMRLEVSQLHRVAEEKSEHDDQAMATLTEILLKRETENHALEKEVELFRERLLQREEENGKVLLLKGPDGYGTTEDEKDLPRSVPSQSNHGEEQAMESPVGPLFSDGKEETEFLLEQLWMLEDEISNLKKKTERKKKKRTKTREDLNPSRQIRTEAERRVSYGPSDSTVADTAGVGNESEFSESVSNETKIRQGGGMYEVPHLGLKHRRSSRPEWSENESSDDGGDEHGKLEIRGDGHNKLDGRSGRRMRKMRRTVSDPQGMITHFDDWSDASDSDHRSKTMLRRNTKWMIADEEGRRSSQHKARVPLDLD